MNHFFDGVNGELSTKRAVLRVRIYDTDKKATLTLKTKLSESAVEGGVSRVGEVTPKSLPPLWHSYPVGTARGQDHSAFRVTQHQRTKPPICAYRDRLARRWSRS